LVVAVQERVGGWLVGGLVGWFGAQHAAERWCGARSKRQVKPNHEFIHKTTLLWQSTSFDGTTQGMLAHPAAPGATVCI
jgi:hypothetical protein